MSFRNYYETPSYGRSRERTTSSTSTERPTTVTAKYMNTTPAYKTSSIPILNHDRATKDDTPISTIANRYSNYNKTDKLPVSKYDSYSSSKSEKSTSKYEKKDYSKLSVPSIPTANKNRDVSPISNLKYSVSRPSRHLSPERRITKNYKDKSRDPSPGDREKDIPSKTDKSTGYSNLSSYKLYPRTTNYTRPVSRTEVKPEITLNNFSRPSSRNEVKPEINVNTYLRPSSRSESKAEINVNSYTRPSSRAETKTDSTLNNYSKSTSRTETKPEITISRYSIPSRLSSNYLRSPPTVKQVSISPVNHTESTKNEAKNCATTTPDQDEPKSQHDPVTNNIHNGTEITAELEDDTETITIITRHTSPTPPGSSAYVRTRRADMAKTIEKTITRAKHRPEMLDKEIQSDRLDDSTRTSRFGSTSRTSMTNWSYYSPSNSNYTGYAGRYSTQYSNLRENSGALSYSPTDRSSRSKSREPDKKEISSYSNSLSEQNDQKYDNSNLSNNLANIDKNTVSIYATEQNKNDDTTDIIINVNLKLKRAKSPEKSSDLVSPEITITNSLLPPQAPKTDANSKTKKIKAKKTSSDSSSDSSSKKKIIKKRSKSVSSTDSEHGTDASEQTSSSKVIPKLTSSSKVQNGLSKLKHSKSRDSNSPESSLTLSTQSSVSEDETMSKSKTNDISRTSADELSIPTDMSGKQSSPLRNENGTEDAKSFLIRALAPVTNLFKRHQENSESNRWLETSTSESTSKDVSNLMTESDRSSKGKNDTANIIASNDDNLVKLKAIRPLEFSDRSYRLDSSSDKKTNLLNSESQNSAPENNIMRKIRHVESGEKAWWMESNSANNSGKQECEISSINNSDRSDSNKVIKKCKFPDEDKPWWLDSCANIPEGIERLSPPKKSSSDSDKSEKFNFFNVRHIESGDKKDWWFTSNENSTNSGKHDQNQPNSHSISKSDSDRNFQLRRIRHIESGERPWWLSSSKNIPEGVEKLPTPPPIEESESSDSEVQVYVPPSHIPPFPLHLPDNEPLGARRSPEGLETPKDNEDYRGRTSPYENNRQFRKPMNSYQKGINKYISRYTDIDDILGTSGQIYSPFMDLILARRTGLVPFDDDECEEIDPTQVRIHDSTAQRPVIKKIRSRSDIVDYRDEDQLDDATLQVFKDGDYGPYLDLDSTLGEQDEELEGLQDSRKNALVLRTQLSVRVHAIIERLLHSQGRELRRALFTLKQILQSDKDLVHEFVANKGLDCLMQVSNMADHNYLDYILRALGQILLYVDGMHGVMGHPRCVQWLYSLIASRFRHVVKTALKLLLVFVEYTDKNCLLLIDAIVSVDNSNGRQPWNNIMKILQDFDASDTELLIYATTLINRCLNNVPHRDTYYDQVDALQDQGIDEIIQLYMSKQGTDLDLLRQLQIFDAVLLYEDGDETGTATKQLDDSVINAIRRRSINLSTSERRKSKKQQAKEKVKQVITHSEPEIKVTNNHRSQFLPSIENKENKELTTALRRRRDRFARQAHHIIQQQEMLNHANDIYNGLFNNTNDTYSSPNSSFKKSNGSITGSNGNFTGSNDSFTGTNGSFTGNNLSFTSTNGSYVTPTKCCTGVNTHLNGSNGSFTSNHWNNYSIHNESFLSNSDSFMSSNDSFASANGSFNTMNGSFCNNNANITNGNHVNGNGSHANGTCLNNKCYTEINGSANGHQDEGDNYINRTSKNFNLGDVIKNGNQRYTSGLKQRIQNGTLGHSVTAADAITVMRQKQLDNVPEVKDDREILLNREHSIKDLAQRLTSPVSPTTEEKPLRVSDMAGIVSKAKEELAKSQSKEIIKSPTIEKSPRVHEIKVSENDLHWEELRKGCRHREYQLCDLDFSDLRDDSDDEVSSPAVNAASGPPPPPPPTMFPPMGLPPPLPGCLPLVSKNSVPQPPNSLSSELSNESDSLTIKKNKKTVKLFWKEVQENPLPIRAKLDGSIWDDLPKVTVDTNMLEHLFESRTNDLIIKKLMEPKRNLILDTKRSNAINIAMKKLPTPQTIKAAIMKMDATVIGREGIEKLLTMLPTEEEKIKIQEAQYANPDLPLGSAEQFLLTLASINELSSRLKLWVFKLDFDNLEKEIAEPLMDLKQGIELLKVNRTFKVILSTLRTVGNYLNGNYAKGFRLEYLSKVVEVKDTVHKHPLLYHICEMIIEKFPDSSDFFSEVGPVIRASKVDFEVLSLNLQKAESDCKASWDHMKRVAKHDSAQIFKTKINEFLTDAAERIILLSIIKKRVLNRFTKFLLYLGVPLCDVHKTKPADFLKVIAEFSLEYRTTRERVLQQLEKKANHRERNKTRGKMIIDVGNYSTKNGDHTADSALKELLKTDPDTDSLTEGRRKSQPKIRRNLVNGDLSADEEILESLVRSASSKRKPIVRERRRNRISDRKNLNRTLDGNQP